MDFLKNNYRILGKIRTARISIFELYWKPLIYFTLNIAYAAKSKL